MILVYEYMTRGSLDKYRRSSSFTWLQRLRVCVDVAHGLAYLHNPDGDRQRVIHRDIKSANILLDDDWDAKVADFGLCRVGIVDQDTFLISNACGTFGYIDPVYHTTGVLTKESDVYSFGVVMFELLSGKPAFDASTPDSPKFLGQIAKRHFEQKRVQEIVNPDIKDQIMYNSLNTFTTVAYQCLHEKQKERPSMDFVAQELEKALHLQVLWIDQLHKISLEEIKLATNNFGDENLIESGHGGIRRMYKGEVIPSKGHKMVVVKRLDTIRKEGEFDFRERVTMLLSLSFRHENLVPLVGYCNEDRERILVYEHECYNGSLDEYIRSGSLTLIQRIKVCVGVARGLTYIHHAQGDVRNLHGCIKSSKILLNEYLEPKILYHEVSELDHDCGSRANRSYPYRDQPTWKMDDVYSFGLLMVEMLWGNMRKSIGDGDANKGRVPFLDSDSDWENNFARLATQCVQNDKRASTRLSMDQILKSLEESLADQVAWIEKLQPYKIPLEEIKSATNNFSVENLIGPGRGGIRRMYKGEIAHTKGPTMVAIKRLGKTRKESEYGFLNHVPMLLSFRHENLVRLVGFCDEDGERIFVYEHEYYVGILNEYIHNSSLTWIQRIKVCVGVARGLNYIHQSQGDEYKGHGCIKSSKILLNENLEPRIFYHESSESGHDCGYHINRRYLLYGHRALMNVDIWKNVDIFSFGLLMAEMLEGKLLTDGDHFPEDKQYALRWYEYDEWYQYDPCMQDQVAVNSVHKFARLASKCMSSLPPSMDKVLKKLEKALVNQARFLHTFQ